MELGRCLVKTSDMTMIDTNRNKLPAHPLSLFGRVAVVTGGNSGIGLGIARGLAEAGCSVAIWARNQEKNSNAARALQNLPGVVACYSCDVTRRESVDAAMRETLADFQYVDGMFANAGSAGGGRSSFLARSVDDLSRMIDANLVGAFHTTQAALAQMKLQADSGRRNGRIVVTSSIAARFGTAQNEHYALTKAALVSLARSIAVEFARYGVTANALLPGYSTTEMTTELFANEKFRSAVLPRIPARRFGEGRDFAGAAIYLMSELAAYHTGDALTIDGGYTVY